MKVLEEEGAGADGGRYRVLSLKVDRGDVWVGEAGGVVRQVDFESGSTVCVYRGAKAPVAAFDWIPTENLLVTGSWDKSVRLYKLSFPNPVEELPGAMDDFIKTLHTFTVDNQTYIALGGSDKSVTLLRYSPGNPLGSRLGIVHKSKFHTRPVNSITSLTGLDGITRIYSADSMGKILECTFDPTTQRLRLERELKTFSTAVYDLKAGWKRVEVQELPASTSSGSPSAFESQVREDESGCFCKDVAELWGASGDKSIASFTLSSPSPTTRVKLVQPDFVKGILPIGLLLPHNHPLYEQFQDALVSAGSDEHLHFYPSPTSIPVQIEGHWHEITSLALHLRLHPTTPSTNSHLPLPKPNQNQNHQEVWIISAGLDGSIRRWNLQLLSKAPQPEFNRPVEGIGIKNQDWNEHSLPPAPTRKTIGEEQVIGMTPEEEAELAELMSDSE